MAASARSRSGRCRFAIPTGAARMAAPFPAEGLVDEPDDTYDVVVCREGLMLVADPARAAAEMRRVLRAAWPVAVAVWGPASATRGPAGSADNALTLPALASITNDTEASLESANRLPALHFQDELSPYAANAVAGPVGDRRSATAKR